MRAGGPGGVGGTYRPLDGPARLAGAIPVLGDRASPLVTADREWLKQFGRPAVKGGPALWRQRRVGRAADQGVGEADLGARWRKAFH